MENTICLDTDFLVNFLRNKDEEVHFINERDGKVILATTVINIFELYFGAYKSGVVGNVTKIEELSRRLHVFPLSLEVAQKAGFLLAELEKKGIPLEFRDLLIGTIANVEGFPLKTNNKKHFDRIPGIQLL